VITSTDPPGRLRTLGGETFRALKSRNYRLFLLGQLVSQLGTWVQLVAQALLVLRLTDSGVALGTVTACQFLPTLILGPWGGVVSDRLDKRRLVLTTQCVMFVFAAMLGTLVLLDRVEIGHVYVLAALLGTVKVFDDPPRRTLAMDFVDRAHIANAVGLNSAVIQVTRIIGPAVAAILISTVGIGWCFIANAVSFLAVIVSTAAIDRDAFPTARLARGRGQIRDGLRYMRAEPALRRCLFMLVVVASMAFNWHVLLPLVAKRVLHGDAGTYATLAALMGVGSLCGALFVARLQSVDDRFLGRAAIGFGLATFALAAAPNFIATAVVTVIWGASVFLFLTAAQTILQMHSIDVMRGRVMAMFGVVVVGVMPLGGMVTGWTADRFSTRTAVLVGGVAALTAGITMLFTSDRAGSFVVEDGPMPALAGFGVNSEVDG
jgi:MFS family permease